MATNDRSEDGSGFPLPQGSAAVVAATDRDMMDSVLRSSNDCIKVLDLDARLVFMSEGGQRVMEVSDFNAIRGCPWPDFWADAGHLAALDAVETAKAGRVGRFQGSARTLAGNLRWWDVQVTPIFGADGRPERLLSISRDITDLKSVENELQQSLALNDSILRSTRDCTVLLDLEGRTVYVSPGGAAAMEIDDVESILGLSWLRVWKDSDQDAARQAIEAARVGGVGRFQGVCPTHRGTVKWWDVIITPLRVDGVVHRLVSVGRDITLRVRAEAELREIQATLEQRVEERTAHLLRAEEALRQAQKMEAVGQLTGGVAHDFNNLLTVIKSSTDLLKRPGLAEERRARYVAAISDSVGRAAKLTGQLLAFARRQALNPVVFDAVGSVETVVEMMGTLTGSRIDITMRMPDRPCYLNADPNQFDTSLVNLLVNARDAMNGEGRLSLAVETVDGMPPARSQPAVPGRFVAVSVTDTGSGIAPEHLDKIFEPFFTTKQVGQGTGLGLSQVFGFTKQSGGGVSVESRPGDGTTFTLYLPSVDEENAVVDAGVSEMLPLVDGHGTRVLVVEDNAEVGHFATQTLEELGYAVTWAADADAALVALAGDPVGFDVVFSDVIMPGMNGIELGQEIRRRHGDLPVVLTSGYSQVLAQEGHCGFELLHKPYSVEDLAHVLRKAAKRKKRRGGSAR